MNQSAIDMCVSLFTMLTTVIKVDYTRMSRDSVHRQVLVTSHVVTWQHLWSVRLSHLGHTCPALVFNGRVNVQHCHHCIWALLRRHSSNLVQSKIEKSFLGVKAKRAKMCI